MTSDIPPRPRPIFSMERLVGVILLGGVSLSVVCVGAGVLWQWSATGHPRFDDALARPPIAGMAIHELTALVRDGLTPGRLVSLGILTLLFTPYLRVLLSLIYFVFVEKNYKYGLITGFVGAVLTTSLFLSS